MTLRRVLCWLSTHMWRWLVQGEVMICIDCGAVQKVRRS